MRRSNKRLKTWAACLSLTFIVCFSTFGHAFSQGVTAGSVLTTSPIAVDLAAKPGSTVSTTMQVQNNSPKAVGIDVRLEKFKAVGENGEAEIYQPSSSDQSMHWVHFSETSLIAQPNVWNAVTVSISVPPNASLGYYYAVLFEPQTQPTAKNTPVIRGANAIFLLLNASTNNETRRLVVTNFASKKSIYEYLPSTFTATVQNTGNIYLAPEGDVFITRTPNGKTLASLDINLGQGTVLPNSSRQYQVSWSDGFPVFQPKKINGQIISNSKGQPEQQLVWNSSSSLSKFRFGKYYAHLALVYNNGLTNVTTNAMVSFWVIPWKLILLIIVIIAAIIVVWKLIKKSALLFIHKMKRKSKK